MDAAWVPVVAGAAGGVITGAVTLSGQWLTGRHQSRERRDGLTWERDQKRADALSGCYNAIAQLQVALLQTEGWLVTWKAHNKEGPRPELDRNLGAGVLAAVDHLRSFGLHVDTTDLRGHLLDYLYRASSQQETPSNELLSALHDITERIGDAGERALSARAGENSGDASATKHAS